MTTKYSWVVKEITNDGSQEVDVQTVTQGEGDADTTAAVMRSLADRLAPPAAALRNLFGGG